MITNPITGESASFSLRDGALEMDFHMKPGGFVPYAHVHPNQEERFKILAGRPRFLVGRGWVDASPGEELVVPPKTKHAFHNPTDEDVHLTITLTPALRTEEMFRSLFALATEGRFTRRMFPKNPLMGALFAREFRHEARSASVFLRTLDVFSPVGAVLARATRTSIGS